MTSRLRALARLRAIEYVELVEAQGSLLWAQLLVATRPRGRLVTEAGATPEPSVPSPARMARAERLARAVHRASRYGVFQPGCLPRAMALSRLLDRRGLTARLCVGVRRDGAELIAHAWVEYGGIPLGEAPGHVRSFSPIADVELLRRW